MAMEFIGIALKNCAAHVNCSVTCGMAAQKEEEQQPRSCH